MMSQGHPGSQQQSPVLLPHCFHVLPLEELGTGLSSTSPPVTSSECQPPLPKYHPLPMCLEYSLSISTQWFSLPSQSQVQLPQEPALLPVPRPREHFMPSLTSRAHCPRFGGLPSTHRPHRCLHVSFALQWP
jgi:hypothetical protein